MKNMDCLFCKIAKGLIPVEKLYEDDKIVAFRDINPAAPVHILIIPIKHIAGAMDLGNEEVDILGPIFTTIKKLAVDFGISESGFRVVNNCGEDGGQTVKHLHFHLLGGRSMEWPPG
jgi:histidine triad (HIT) family protein